MCVIFFLVEIMLQFSISASFLKRKVNLVDTFERSK